MFAYIPKKKYYNQATKVEKNLENMQKKNII